MTSRTAWRRFQQVFGVPYFSSDEHEWDAVTLRGGSVAPYSLRH